MYKQGEIAIKQAKNIKVSKSKYLGTPGTYSNIYKRNKMSK